MSVGLVVSAVWVAVAVVDVVPIEAGRCREVAVYRAHFALRSCEWNDEGSPDFTCSHRLRSPLGWFAPVDCGPDGWAHDGPWVAERWGDPWFDG
ncbi:MAG: hypothetical protein ABMA64_05855 [Myxococcota bacterium]